MSLPESITKQLNHRTIRRFKDEKLPKETETLLFDVANRTASSNAHQTFSMINITDPVLRAKIAKVSGQDYVNDCPLFVLFIIDSYRNFSVVNQVGGNTQPASDMDRFFQGFTDAVLAAQNMVNAAETLDLGTNYFGSILNDSRRIIELCKLPKLTMPILGLGIGIPDQAPLLKPRIPIELKVFENTYKLEDNYEEALKGYDQELSKYYDLRNPDQPLSRFVEQLQTKYENVNVNRTEVLKVIKSQGYDLKIQ
jgi:nitroreductase